MSKVELYERIRLDQASHGWGIRRLAREHRCHRREVGQALSSVPPPVSVMARPKPVLGPWMSTMEAILALDQKAPRKQRHTAHRMWVRLVKEFGATVAESTVREHVSERRRELFGRGRGDGAAGARPRRGGAGRPVGVPGEVQAGWGEQKVDFFEIRASHSGAAFHWPMRTKTQQAFLEAHAEAFDHFGGVFATVRCDYVPRHIIRILCPVGLCGRDAHSVRFRTGQRLAKGPAGHITQAGWSRLPPPPIDSEEVVHAVIRGWLGHADLSTTNRYAEINTKTKQAALRATEPPGTSEAFRTKPIWRTEESLLKWLNSP